MEYLVLEEACTEKSKSTTAAAVYYRKKKMCTLSNLPKKPNRKF